jgi:hypothetical protein
MATDLGYLGIAERHTIATVASADHIFDLAFVERSGGEGLGVGVFGGGDNVRSGIDQRAPNNLADLVDDDRFRLG